MRLDHEHVRKLAVAYGQGSDGEQSITLDIPFMLQAMDRLTMWERGLLQDRIARAAISNKKTLDQRILLALFAADSRDAAAFNAATAPLPEPSEDDGSDALNEPETAMQTAGQNHV